MELYQLKTFVLIADEGNLTRAAEKLFTSQPAISAQVKALEEELGLSLFERSARGMTLTAAGQQLYESAQQTLASAEALKQTALGLQQELLGEPRIGIHTDFEFARVGRLHKALTGKHQQLRPHFIQSISPSILADIRVGKLDGGYFFGPCQDANLSIIHLQQTPMTVVAPAAWQDRISHASLADLAQLPWVYTTETCPFRLLMNEMFTLTGTTPTKTAYVDSEDAVRELVCAGAGLSLLRSDDAAWSEKEGMVSCWPGKTPGISLQFAVLRRRLGEPLIKALLEEITTTWQLGDTPHPEQAVD